MGIAYCDFDLAVAQTCAHPSRQQQSSGVMALPEAGTALAELPSSVFTAILWGLDPGDCVRLSLVRQQL